MKSLILIALLLLGTLSSARSQILLGPPYTYPFINGGGPGHATTKDANLDRAITICDAHTHYNGITDGQWRDYAFDAGWRDACAPVINAREKSGAARQIAERKAKETADKAWLEDYAKGLKP